VTEGHESKESENCSPRASNVTDYLWLSTTLCCVYDSDWIGILAYCVLHTVQYKTYLCVCMSVKMSQLWQPDQIMLKKKTY